MSIVSHLGASVILIISGTYSTPGTTIVTDYTRLEDETLATSESRSGTSGNPRLDEIFSETSS